MNEKNDSSLSFNSYLLSLLKYTAASSLALGALTCILIFIVGETSMNFDIGLEIEPFDGLWVLVGLPVITLLVLLIVSPVSFIIYRLFAYKGAKSDATDN